jgi:hypothetical protein
MRISFNEKLIAYLALISGLSVSAVAVYYSVAGLAAIFASAVVPIIIMGVTLEIGKIVATVWIKQNWSIAPRLIRTYLVVAITVLMLITSMGIFGFLSKAHLDQSMPSGDVMDRIAVIDGKIQTERDNIDAAKRALKQMDESVDQTMARSTSETGAARSAALRRSQQKERGQLQNDIANSQSRISTLTQERAPIAKELRQVEAEVGPIKYIAGFVYGATDSTILEKAVTWVIIALIVVFDPLALILLLASQISFQNFRERQREEEETTLAYIADVGEKPTEEEKAAYEQDDGPLTDQQIEQIKESVSATNTATVISGSSMFDNTIAPIVVPSETAIKLGSASIVNRTKVFPRKTTPPVTETYVQNEEQIESNLWSSTTENSITKEDYTTAVHIQKTEEIKTYIEKVKSNQMSIDDVPFEFQAIVKTRI